MREVITVTCTLQRRIHQRTRWVDVVLLCLLRVIPIQYSECEFPDTTHDVALIYLRLNLFLSRARALTQMSSFKIPLPKAI